MYFDNPYLSSSETFGHRKKKIGCLKDVPVKKKKDFR